MFRFLLHGSFLQVITIGFLLANQHNHVQAFAEMEPTPPWSGSLYGKRGIDFDSVPNVYTAPDEGRLKPVFNAEMFCNLLVRTCSSGFTSSFVAKRPAEIKSRTPINGAIYGKRAKRFIFDVVDIPAGGSGRYVPRKEPVSSINAGFDSWCQTALKFCVYED